MKNTFGVFSIKIMKVNGDVIMLFSRTFGKSLKRSFDPFYYEGEGVVLRH